MVEPSNGLEDKIPCFACGALVPDIDGPVHRYMDSAPGCWKMYGEILAREYSPEYYDAYVQRITVDTYAVQHPGKQQERRAIQSVNSHLTSLYLVYEKNISGEKATAYIKHVVENESMVSRFFWLAPPSFERTLHITDVLNAQDMSEHKKIVTDWGYSVWQAWKGKHFQTIKEHTETILDLY